MKRILIKNAKIVNEKHVEDRDLLIEGKYIRRIDSDISDGNATIIDASGQYLLPGMIDDQVHFREPGFTHKGDIQSESRACVAGGITSFIEQPNTSPQTITIDRLEAKMKRAKATSFANYSFMIGGTNDNLEIIKSLDKKSCAGIKLFLGSSTGNMLVDDPDTLEAVFNNTDLVISAHCEDEQTIRNNLAHYQALYGDDIPVALHPKIRSGEACYLSSSYAIALAKKTGARLHVFHVSTAKECALFDNSIPLKDKKITAEACVHHLWFCDENYDDKGTLIKWNPAIKTAGDREVLWNAVRDGRIDVIATDHAPHTLAEKQQVYTKAPSGGPLVQHALTALIEKHLKGCISIEMLVEKVCHNPAILFDIENRGFIREGYFADLVLVNIHKPWEVKKNNILYKCQWSPFEGEQFHSEITHTFVNGHLAYQCGKISEERCAMRLTFEK